MTTTSRRAFLRALIAAPIALQVSRVEAQRMRILQHAPVGNWDSMHRDTIINYLTWDRTRWTANIAENRFLHAPEGDWRRAHPDTIINYLTWDGTPWTARLRGSTFVHWPSGNPSRSHEDTIINYLAWDGSRWTARLET